MRVGAGWSWGIRGRGRVVWAGARCGEPQSPRADPGVNRFLLLSSGVRPWPGYLAARSPDSPFPIRCLPA